jgi:hypothetical protein
MSKHIPGPWTADHDAFIRAHDTIICRVGPAYDYQLCDKANARVIAAAPDGYDLLVDLDSFIDCVNDDSARRRMKDRLAAYFKKVDGEE